MLMIYVSNNGLNTGVRCIYLIIGNWLIVIMIIVWLFTCVYLSWCQNYRPVKTYYLAFSIWNINKRNAANWYYKCFDVP